MASCVILLDGHSLFQALASVVHLVIWNWHELSSCYQTWPSNSAPDDLLAITDLAFLIILAVLGTMFLQQSVYASWVAKGGASIARWQVQRALFIQSNGALGKSGLGTFSIVNRQLVIIILT